MSERVPEFEELLTYIRDERSFDFTGYKRPSLMRRISKRMQDINVESYAEYQDYLTTHPDEFVQLFNTILINVTSFFRDEVAWDFLRQEIVPQIIDGQDGSRDQIRLWSTGCATGEEAFSLAMVFVEAMGEEAFRKRMKIYATDIDEDALQQGRHAEYTAAQLDPVPPELRQRYFEARNGNFVFRGDLRRGVIFGRHDLIQDPPISRISLLLSRNTLMYFDSNTQARILANFHFSLRDNGFLFLGKSEALAARSELFVPVDLKRRVFAKAPRDAPRRLYVAPPTGAEEDQLARLASDALIREAGFETVPVAQIVVDRDENVVLANLQARAFFGLSQRDIGRPLKDLDVSFKPVELRSRIEQVTNERHVVALRDVEWNVGSELRYLDVQVAPLISTGGDLLGTGISFIEVTRYRRLQEALQDSRREIETAYEELQSTVEELETTNEELQSTNEELETTNEELQSTNEELETLNEELHSTNEELETMNDELNDRSLELNSANAFLSTVLGSLRAGIIVVNSELVVEAWNEEARDLWGLSQDEVLGKHLFNLDIGLPLDQLRGPLRETIAENDGQRELSVTAVNRRGRQIECRISLTPLGNPTDGHGGAIVMMQPSDAAS